MASLSLDVASQMMVSEDTGFMFERGQSLRAVGRVKVAGWRPLIALFSFPGCACFDKGLIGMIVQDSSSDTERDSSVRGKPLLEAQETILSRISTATANLLLALCSTPASGRKLVPAHGS